MTLTLQNALTLRAVGVATIPVNADKRPRIAWKQYQTQLPTEDELTQWFGTGDAGIAVCAGKILCIDFDTKYAPDIFRRFCARAQEVGLDGLVVTLVRQRTPSGGYHLVMRCNDASIANEKLACRPATAEERQANPHVREFVMSETRGDRGYFLVDPSPGYHLESGDWSSIPVISEEDRDALLDLARSFDERAPAEVAHHEPRTPAYSSPGLTPGDDYDQRADVPALLQAHGWAHAHGAYWTRPGKSRGISASWDHDGNGRFVVFTASSEFEPNHSYKPWHVFAILECGGDWARAASELRRQGFGAPRPTSASSVERSPLSVPFAGVEPSQDDPPGVEGTEPTPSDLSVEPLIAGQAMSGKAAAFSAMVSAQEVERIRQLLRERAYDETREPPPLRPRFELGGVVICTPGNLCAITAPVKVGKSALGSALIAATMVPPGTDADTLSAVGYNADGKALIYFDTEQSPDDFWHCVDRAKRRAHATKRPSWLEAHTLAGASARDCRLALAVKMADAAVAHGGIHSVIIDGVADLVCDVNDAAESNALVAELHALAIHYDCSIICVIHKNPGSDKVRGHLGSQIERKAETNLSLEKENEVTVIWSAKQRRAPIDKRTGPRFRWDDDLRMHVSVVSPTASISRKLVELQDMATEAFADACRMRYADLVRALIEIREISEPTAKRRVAEMRQHGVLAVGQQGMLEIAHVTEAAA